MLKQEESSNKRPLKRKQYPVEPGLYNTMKDKATRKQRRKLDPELELTSLEMDKQVRRDPHCADHSEIQCINLSGL